MHITADNAVNPIEYSFFMKPNPGRIELYNLKNLYGVGAQMIFYVTSGKDTDWLIMEFRGGIVQVKLLHKDSLILSKSLEEISDDTPLTVIIQDGALTVSVGNDRQTINGMSAFKGNFTTQSISGDLRAYKFINEK